jgi:hypothetical protein
LLVIGLIVLVAGVTTLPGGWATALLGGGITAFGGFEVNFTYNQIRGEDKSIRAKQSGNNNTQTNQTNPVNSPVIKAENVHQYFGPLEPKSRKKAPKLVAKTEDPADLLCNGVYHIKDYQEFSAQVGEGDKIVGHVKSDYPVSIQILNTRNYNIFYDIQEGDVDSDTNYNALYTINDTSDTEISWVASKAGNVMIVITEGSENTEDTDEELIKVTARIKIVRV